MNRLMVFLMLVTTRLMMKVCHVTYTGNMIFIYWEIIYKPLITHFHIFLYFLNFITKSDGKVSTWLKKWNNGWSRDNFRDPQWLLVLSTSNRWFVDNKVKENVCFWHFWCLIIIMLKTSVSFIRLSISHEFALLMCFWRFNGKVQK